MKKSLFLLLALLLVGMLILSLSACEDVPDGAQDSSTQGDGEQDGDTQGTGTQGGDTQSEGEHKHAFNKKSTASKYLKSEATCEAKAVYYYSCECGDKGTQAFESGELLAHEYTVKNTDSKYLKATATEDTAAIYYYSCECGKKGSTTFTDGTALESDHAHVYDQKSATKEYLKSKATCQKKALYYYSCECGRKGSATFESGTLAQHIYTASVKSASCSTDGYTEHVCACGDSYKDSYTSAKGHDFQECRKMTLGTNHNATVCTRCQLEVVAYGNADGTWTTQPKSVMYYVTGEPFICSSGGLDYQPSYRYLRKRCYARFQRSRTGAVGALFRRRQKDNDRRGYYDHRHQRVSRTEASIRSNVRNGGFGKDHQGKQHQLKYDIVYRRKGC